MLKLRNLFRAMKSIGAIFIIALVFTASAARAETIELKDGTKVSGTVVDENDEMLTLKVKFGTIKYAKSEIKSRDADDPVAAEPPKKAKTEVANSGGQKPENAPSASVTPETETGVVPRKGQLWADAPNSAVAVVGIVSPGEILKRLRGLIQQVTASSPELEKQWQDGQAALTASLGVDPTDPGKLATLGLDPAQPLALSVLELEASGEPSGAVVSFGVNDEQKFLTFVKALADREHSTLSENTAGEPKVLRLNKEGVLAVTNGRGYVMSGPHGEKLEAALRQFLVDKNRNPILQAPGLTAALDAIGGAGEATAYVDLKTILQHIPSMPALVGDFRSVSLKVSSKLNVLSLNMNPDSRLVKALRPGASPKDFIAKGEKPLVSVSISLADPIELVRYIVQSTPGGEAQLAQVSQNLARNTGMTLKDWGEVLKDGNVGVLVYKADPPANIGIIGYLKLQQSDPDRVSKVQAFAQNYISVAQRSAPALAQMSFDKALIGDYVVFGNAVKQIQALKSNSTAQWQPINADGDILCADYSIGEFLQHMQRVVPQFKNGNPALANAGKLSFSIKSKGDSVQLSTDRLEASAAGAGVFAGLVLPVLARAREAARRASSAHNLSQIGKALILYADVPANAQYPKDPVELIPDFLSDARCCINPRFPKQDVGYIYLPGSTPNDAANIVVYENATEANPAGRNVLLADGSVEWLDEPYFQDAFKKTKDMLKAANVQAKEIPISFKALSEIKKK